MASEDERIAELESRIEKLEAQLPDGVSRRDALKLGGVGLLGALGGGGAALGATGTAEAGTAQSGQLGTTSNPLDIVIEDLIDQQGNIVASADAGALKGSDLQYELGIFANQPIVDPTHDNYGAVGDGETNDTTALQSALNQGGIIWIPHSHTFRADGLTTPTGESVLIVGKGTIKMRDADNSSDFVLSLEGAGCVAKNITIDGNGSTTANTGRNEGLRLSGAMSKAIDVTVKNTKDGPTANGIYTNVDNTRIVRPTITDAGYGGIRLDGSTYIEDPVINDPAEKGIVANGQIDGTVEVSGGEISAPSASAGGGLLFDAGSGNTIESVVVDGITVKDAWSANQLKASNVEDTSIDQTIFKGSGEIAVGGTGTSVTLSNSVLETNLNLTVPDAKILGGRITGTGYVEPGDTELLLDGVNIDATTDGFIEYTNTSATVALRNSTIDIGAGNRIIRASDGIPQGNVEIENNTLLTGDITSGIDSRDTGIIYNGILGEIAGGVDVGSATGLPGGTLAEANGTTGTDNAVYRFDNGDGVWILVDGTDTVTPS